MGTQDAIFESLGCCVLIPTYNNAGTLAAVLHSVLNLTTHVIVVDDGSTDNTCEILSNFPMLQLISYPTNKGKGYALRQGFLKAEELHYQYALTIDSDGQHSAGEMLRFLDCIREFPQSAIVGARNMDQEGIPKKSSFGHTFSNFWFRFETGIDIPDTQSGYRLYPLFPMKGMRFYSNKYEFEIEVLVRLAWKKIPVRSVPVSVHYEPKETRVSHFRPFRDFSRVSILNVVLVFITLLWILPKKFFSQLNAKGIRQFIDQELIASHESNTRKTASVMLGLFMGILPVWGFQMILALALAYAFRLNKALVIVASNISIPPLLPFILYASYQTGALLMLHPAQLSFSSDITFSSIQDSLLQYLLGSLLFGTILSILGGGFTLLLLLFFRKK